MSLKVMFLNYQILNIERRIDVYSYIYFLFRDFTSSSPIWKLVYLLRQINFQRLITCLNLSILGGCLSFWWIIDPQEIFIIAESRWWQSIKAISPFSSTSIRLNSRLQWEPAISRASSLDTIRSRGRQSSKVRFPKTSHGLVRW